MVLALRMLNGLRLSVEPEEKEEEGEGKGKEEEHEKRGGKERHSQLSSEEMELAREIFREHARGDDRIDKSDMVIT